MRASELQYELPPDLIAQRPLDARDESRLLVYERMTGDVRHRRFRDLAEELAPGDLTVVNDSRVVPARLRLRRPGGGDAEVLLLERRNGNGIWEALARPSRRLRPGLRLEGLRSSSVGGGVVGVPSSSSMVTPFLDEGRGRGNGAAETSSVELVERIGQGRWLVRVEGEPDGEVPLPPYIKEQLVDPERYQTVYAREAGSAAAPTAGLHFTPDLLARLQVERVTLHVGLDTFRPLKTSTVEEHTLHGERYCVAPAAWERITTATRVVAVGTTTVRVLETLTRGGPLEGRTELLVVPGFEFRRVDALVTNFHLPGSTLLALVMSFAGIEQTRELYRMAIAMRYRFYSFGDAMVIL